MQYGNEPCGIAALADLVSIKTGKLNSNAAVENGAYPFFTCSRETYKVDTYSFDCEAVLLAGNNANGVYPVKYHKGRFDAYQRTYVIRSVDERVLNNRYLFYALQLELDLLQSLSTGSATKFLTLTILNALKVRVPSLSDQNRIVSILGAYDDLIENNTRRIEILEEMARRLYDEWFVQFRFPGHEGVDFKASELGLIPEGWAVTELEEVVHLTMGQSPSSEFYNEVGKGLPFHQGVTGFGDYFPSNKSYCTIEARVANEGDILFSVRAPVGRINVAKEKIVIGRGVSALRSKTDHQIFLLSQLRCIFKEEDSMGNGAIFKAVTKKDMQSIKLLQPSAEVIGRFELIAAPLWRLIRILSDKNTNLSKQRDLLLPKLISGEIDVSDIPMPT